MRSEELDRVDVATSLLNAKIELSKAINLLDELQEEGKADISEWGKLYNIKNELRDFIEEYRIQTK
jgi:hypothetical protein